MDGLTVLFIGGYGRSGSTLLDRLLGRVDGICSCGEIRHIWREGFLGDRRCGCGVPFSSCPFWDRVSGHAFGGRSGLDLPEILRLKDRVDRSWRIPQIVAGRPAAFAAELESYLALLRRLYAGIAEVSGCDVLVDSTKDVSHGYLLTRLGATIDLRVLHLVRDARAAAHSWARTRHHPGWDRTMQRYGPLRAALEWDAINALTSRLRSRAGRYAVLRYEDFAADPEAALEWVLRAVLDAGDRDVPWTAPRTIELGVDHTVAGNPVRFHRGPLEVRADEEWRDRMQPAAKALVGALAAPMLRSYGYSVRPV